MSVDPMAPDASPDALPKRFGMRRVNDVPLYLGGAVLGGFLIVMAMVATHRAQQQRPSMAKLPEQAGTSIRLAQEVAGERAGGIIAPAAPTLPPTDGLVSLSDDGHSGRPEHSEQRELAVPEGLRAPGFDEATERLRQAKLQALEEAAKAKTGVQLTLPRSAGAQVDGRSRAPISRDEMLARLASARGQAEVARSEDPTSAYRARLQQLRQMGIGVDGSTGPGASIPVAGKGNGDASGGIGDYDQFGSRNAGDRWRLDTEPQAPRSPYELRAGFVVPATLISGINSDLPGQIVAQVSQNVYDTASGNWLLIPQGARLVGSYSSNVAFGQARVLVAWQRVVFPDGKALDLGAMPGGDAAGDAGFTDQVNNHYLRTFASAFLMSGVTAGVAYSQRQNQAGSAYGAPTASSALSEALGQQLGQVTAQMIAKNLTVSPTLEIRPGYRFNVIVTKDLTFSKPYRSFDY